ncbi:MAG: mannonate dehydratase, partial [Treponema sp.]|nr:mannonate dehydratase [Treponema sp.]
MKFTMRWFGRKHDSVTLEQIRQIPGVTGIITTLYGTQPGEVWEKGAIRAMKEEVEAAGFTLEGIESVNIHDSIKIGSPDREKYIDNYITTLERLGEAGIRMVCYNFMAIFDWTRSDLAKVRSDGATVMSYDQRVIDLINPHEMSSVMNAKSNGYALAGWEPERLGRLKELFDLYKELTGERLRNNLKYFLERIMPVCDKYDINMAIHPDDPAWSVFGLPRIVTGKEPLLGIVNMVDNPHNGVTLCTGSLGTNPANDIPDIIRSLKGRVHFAHVRNLRHNGPGDFEESAHFSRDGSLDIFSIMKALHDIGFQGP